MSNPLRSKTFKIDDIRWKFVSASVRHSLYLSAYSTALSDLLCRADKLTVLLEDRAAIAFIFTSFSETLFSQSAQTTFHAVRQRHRPTQDHFLMQSVPMQGPFLFVGRFWKQLMRNLTCTRGRVGDCLFVCLFFIKENQIFFFLQFHRK